jgi:hypothetical protein
MRSNDPAQLISSAHKEVHILILYLFNFLRLYLSTRRTLGTFRAGQIFYIPPLNVVSLTAHRHFLVSLLSLSLSLTISLRPLRDWNALKQSLHTYYTIFSSLVNTSQKRHYESDDKRFQVHSNTISWHQPRHLPLISCLLHHSFHAIYLSLYKQ